MAELFDFMKYLKAEVLMSSFIPYASHVTENTVRLKNGELLQIMRLQGAAHESADIEDINAWHDQLNGLIRNIASPNLAIWTHVVRREYKEYPDGTFAPGFCRDFNEKYQQAMAQDRMLVNELYITFLYRPQSTKAASWFASFKKQSVEEREQALLDDMESLADIISAAKTGLARYEPEVLGCYEYDEIMFSEVAEFLSFLVNGEWHRFPLPRSEMANLMSMTRPFFGKGGLIALKTPSKTRLAAILVIQEYPSITKPGVLDDLLSLPFDMVMTQSFTCISKPVAIGRMTRQQQRMVNAGDVAKSQIAEIDQALDDLVSNRFVMGKVHDYQQQ